MRLWADQGKIPEPDPDLAADMYVMARRVLAESGYRHYEISNWAQPGQESRHNLIYWRNEPYLGVGPGAHSRLGDVPLLDNPLAPRLREPRGSMAAVVTGTARRLRRAGAARGADGGKAGSISTGTRPAPRPCSSACACWTGWTCARPPPPWAGTWPARLPRRNRGVPRSGPAAPRGRRHPPGRGGLPDRQPGPHPLPVIASGGMVF